MGWWKIKSVESGQVDFDNPPSGCAEGELINAVPGRDTVESHYNGDGPADIMGSAIDQIAYEYERDWGRQPYYEELLACFNFVCNRYKEKGQYESRYDSRRRDLHAEIDVLRQRYNLPSDWPLKNESVPKNTFYAMSEADRQEVKMIGENIEKLRELLR